jgi:Ca2+-binding RTX toxin-like protein
MSSHLVSRRSIRAASALTLALAAGLAVPLALSGTADAATPSATAAVNEYGWQLTYTAAAGQANNVTITESSAGSDEIIYVIDDVVPITPGKDCVYPSSADDTKVSCTVVAVDSQDPVAALVADFGDGNDTVVLNNTPGQEYNFNSLTLGAGNDKLTDSGLDGNSVYGDAGSDTITVGDNAWVQGGDGADTINANGEYDIADGGAGADTLNGGADSQSLSGGDDNDRINGGKGDDQLYGGKGNDVLYGNSGNDVLYGNSGDDQLYGGPGTDTLSGGAGTNVLHQD